MNSSTDVPLSQSSTPSLTPSDLLSAAEFERLRPRLQPLIAQIRDQRRHRLGAHATIVFENRETVLWQVHEVLRVEGRTRQAQAAEELHRYDALVARPGELRATVLVDGGTPTEGEELSGRLAGANETLELRVGGISCFADCVESAPHPTCPVRYLRFHLRREGIGARQLVDRPVSLLLHGAQPSIATLGPDVRAALANDLQVSQRPWLPSAFTA